MQQHHNKSVRPLDLGVVMVEEEMVEEEMVEEEMEEAVMMEVWDPHFCAQ